MAANRSGCLNKTSIYKPMLVAAIFVRCCYRQLNFRGMKKPSKKEIELFLKEEFPHIEFDGVKFEECKPNYCWFKVISFGRMIGQADYELGDNYWDNVKRHLKWCFG